MGIIVRGSYYSGYALRVLITLEELEVTDYHWESVNVSKGEHKTAEYLQLNPFGQIPVLQDDDFTIFESRAITRYLAEKYANQGTPLLGKTLKEKALVNQWLEVESQQYDRPVAEVVRQVVIGPHFGRTPKEDVIVEETAKLEKVLDVYEAHLSKRKYFAGDFFSLADLHHLPGTYLLVHTGKKSALFTTRPHLKAWWEDISLRPAFKKVMAKTPFQ